MKENSTTCSQRENATARPLSSSNDHLVAARENSMSNDSSSTPPAFKPKKSVALSGTPAGNTALCTVGHSGNDLHYRGYDIKDLAAHCEFEEVAYLLVHGKLPNTVELTAYKNSLRMLRSLPAAVKEALELLPPSTHQIGRAHV